MTLITEWKDKLDTSMLRARADRAEHYAEAALVVALAGVDQAEKAMLSAGLARKDAVAVKAKRGHNDILIATRLLGIYARGWNFHGRRRL